MTDKVPREKHNGTYSPELVGGGSEHKSSAEASAATVVPNGLRVLVVCPEMCCYCFEVLIAHLTNAHYSSRSPFLKCFKNDE